MIHTFDNSGNYLSTYSSLEELSNKTQAYTCISDMPINTLLNNYHFDLNDSCLKPNSPPIDDKLLSVYEIASIRDSAIQDIAKNTLIKLTNGVYIDSITSYIEATNSNIEELKLKAEYCAISGKNSINIENTYMAYKEISVSVLKDIIKLLIIYNIEMLLVKQDAIQKVKDLYDVEKIRAIVSETI